MFSLLTINATQQGPTYQLDPAPSQIEADRRFAVRMALAAARRRRLDRILAPFLSLVRVIRLDPLAPSASDPTHHFL